MSSRTDWRRENGHFDGARAAQARFWFGEEVRQGLLRQLQTPEARAVMQALAEKVAAGDVSATRAAEEVLAKLGRA